MTSASITRPTADEYFTYYGTYVNKVPAGDIRTLMEAQIGEVREFFGQLPEAEASVLHAPYTWTIKQVVGHLIDTERIFAERLHHFAMRDPQPLPGMEQNDYINAADYVTPTLAVLVEELLFLRQANSLLLRRLTPEAWDNHGTASGHSVTVRALAYMLVGHINHHLDIVRQRVAR
ncbi:MAG: DinB family protein [Planctomycetes bacterium]|nr:DinB family protein [Planctomycetota bacterium]